MQKMLNLADITLSQAFFVRDTINQETVEDYIEAINNKVVFPPIDVFKVGRGYMLADGWHRCYAFRKANRKTIVAHVHEGDKDECLKFALRSNQSHGLRRTNADKRRCAILAIREWPKLSDHELAKLCGVSHTYIAKIKAAMTPPSKPKAEPKEREEPIPMLEPQPEPEPEVEVNGRRDSMGFPIPEKVEVFWIRSFEVQSVLDSAQELLRQLENAKNSQDPLWHEVVFQSAIADLERVVQNLETAKPYAVCTSCQGQLTETCTLCGSKGFISKFRFDTLVPEEIREMRKKGCV